MWDPAQLEKMFQEAEAEVDLNGRASPTSTKRVSTSVSPRKRSPRKGEKAKRIVVEDVLSNTAASAGEVEEVVGVDDADVSLGGQMDVDADFADVEDDAAHDVRMNIDEAGSSKPPPLSKPVRLSMRAAQEQGSSSDASAKRRLVRRFTSRNTDDEGQLPDDPHTDVPPPKRALRTYGSAKKAQNDVPAGSPTSSPSPVKKPASLRRPLVVSDDDVTMASPAKPQSPSKATAKKKKGPPGIRVTKIKDDAPQPEHKKRKTLDSLLESESDSTDEEDVRSVLGDLIKNGRTSRTSAPHTAAPSDKVGQTPQLLRSRRCRGPLSAQDVWRRSQRTQKLLCPHGTLHQKMRALRRLLDEHDA